MVWSGNSGRHGLSPDSVLVQEMGEPLILINAYDLSVGPPTWTNEKVALHAWRLF
jgi:hypothetical protein